MIEIWFTGPEGTVGAGFTLATAERLALAKAASEKVLSRVIAGPGEHTLSRDDAIVTQRLIVSRGGERAILYETAPGEREGSVRVHSVIIGAGGESRRSLSGYEEPSASGTGQLRVHVLVSDDASTPEFASLRDVAPVLDRLY